MMHIKIPHYIYLSNNRSILENPSALTFGVNQKFSYKNVFDDTLEQYSQDQSQMRGFEEAKQLVEQAKLSRNSVERGLLLVGDRIILPEKAGEIDLIADAQGKLSTNFLEEHALKKVFVQVSPIDNSRNVLKVIPSQSFDQISAESHQWKVLWIRGVNHYKDGYRDTRETLGILYRNGEKNTCILPGKLFLDCLEQQQQDKKRNGSNMQNNRHNDFPKQVKTESYLT